MLVRKSRRALVREGLARWSCAAASRRTAGCARRWPTAASEDGFALYIPPPERCTDNAAMIAAAGTQLLARGERAGLDLAVDPGLPL